MIAELVAREQVAQITAALPGERRPLDSEDTAGGLVTAGGGYIDTQPPPTH
ncbi:hypothetical protein L1080_035195 [Rhodococcus sp. MSC1_016]|jgi:hypothetical protein|uniref:hypothetical protein n=1 Tax=Rhodococcus sp. MSC1_016 TaxID=2909266 RepID=UPI00202ECAD6|nr:hypothetical protein [Rhodococcus sp. MSC1_016]